MNAYFFDVGETLIDETRQWREWADVLGVPHLTFFAAFGVVVARGESHRNAIQLVRPDVTDAQARELFAAAGKRYRILREDLYPDAVPCLTGLRARGCFVGVAGNQPQEAFEDLRALGLPLDYLATSFMLGVAKPEPAFFAVLAETAHNAGADRIFYVGDRLDNDVLASRDAGFVPILIRRGPWGIVHVAQAHDLHIRVIESLEQL